LGKAPQKQLEEVFKESHWRKMLYHDIQTLNDMAASLVANGESQMAGKCLAKALMKVRSGLKEFASSEQNEMDDRSRSSRLEPTMFPVPRGVGDGPQSYAKESTIDFYSTPFVFANLEKEEQESDHSLNTLHSIQRCGIGCLFNLGLACHLAWVRNDQPHNQLLLQKALEFYSKAYDAISQTYPRQTKNPSKHFRLDPQDSLALIVMALCTNIWHCHHESCSGLHELQLWHGNLLRALSFAEKEHKLDESFHFFCLFALVTGSLVTARAA
jgi:hypothetical protein